jgi:hypothetical protein
MEIVLIHTYKWCHAFTNLHGVTSQKTATFTVTTLKCIVIVDPTENFVRSKNKHATYKIGIMKTKTMTVIYIQQNVLY